MRRLGVLRVAAIGILAGGPLPAALAQEAGAPLRFETQKPEDPIAARARVVATALGFAAWPRTSELYPAPAVGRALFREPAGLAEEVRSCTTVRIGDESWPRCTWSWKALREGRPPSGEDWLDLEITVTPGSRAAQEHLLLTLADNMLPLEGLDVVYRAAKRPEGVGHVAVQVQAPNGYDSRLWFLRGNLVFRVWGHGRLAAEALPLALRLDERVAAQQPLSPEELRARRPAVPAPRP